MLEDDPALSDEVLVDDPVLEDDPVLVDDPVLDVVFPASEVCPFGSVVDAEDDAVDGVVDDAVVDDAVADDAGDDVGVVDEDDVDDEDDGDDVDDGDEVDDVSDFVTPFVDVLGGVSVCAVVVLAARVDAVTAGA
ncbi:MAG TPA: hypothetical protein VH166_13065 [Mycobacterium sp.]|nr:hypothetical protein [Mycobacterium sp.]